MTYIQEKQINSNQAFNKEDWASEYKNVEKELTNEPEKTSKILMKFCDLKWSKEILNFYDRSNMIVTSASNIQIRKKIYTYNENIFNEYEKYFLDYFSNNYK